MNKLSETMGTVQIGTPQTHANMMIYPLSLKNGHSRGYQTLDEALEAKTMEVLEVSEGGSVPSLRVRNSGALPVLLVVGEELVGAKQNRVLNTSLLVPAQSELEIPVSCVEQGRWFYRGRQFSSSPSPSHMKLRKDQTESVTRSLRLSSHDFHADQEMVWGEVTRKMSFHAASSGTHAMHDMYDQLDGKINDYTAAFQAPGTQGILVSINGNVVGADVFDHAETLQKLWPKLLRSYAVDAIEHSTAEAHPERAMDTQGFLQAAVQATDETYASVGIGEDVRLSSEQISGSGLLWEDKVIHATLFNKQA